MRWMEKRPTNITGSSAPLTGRQCVPPQNRKGFPFIPKGQETMNDKHEHGPHCGHGCDHDHDHDHSHEHGAIYVPPPEEHRDLTPEQVTGLRANYATVLSHTAQDWFTNGGIDVVNDAVFKYIQHHPRLFDPHGDVIFENIEMANLVLAGQELGIKEPEELCVGIIPRQVGMIKPKGQPQPEVMQNTILIGNAEEVGGMVMAAFRAYYNLEEEVKPKLTPRDRAEQRKRLRKKNKRK